MTNEVTTQRCVNCGSDLFQRMRHNLILMDVRLIVQHWSAPRLVEDDSLVCHPCWTMALHHSRTQIINEPTTSCGHRRSICVYCGCSLLRTRSHRLHTETERESCIRNMVMEQIAPCQIHGSDQLCHTC